MEHQEKTGFGAPWRLRSGGYLAGLVKGPTMTASLFPLCKTLQSKF